jgi:hypothetical protein
LVRDYERKISWEQQMASGAIDQLSDTCIIGRRKFWSSVFAIEPETATTLVDKSFLLFRQIPPRVWKEIARDIGGNGTRGDDWRFFGLRDEVFQSIRNGEIWRWLIDHASVHPRAEALIKALQDWAHHWNLLNDWCLDWTLTTLTYWRVNGRARANLDIPTPMTSFTVYPRPRMFVFRYLVPAYTILARTAKPSDVEIAIRGAFEEALGGFNAQRRIRTNKTNLDHYRWLADYQVQKWSAKRIKDSVATYCADVKTVDKGVKAAANEIGLTLRPHLKAGRHRKTTPQ